MHLPTHETWLDLARHDGEPSVTLSIPRADDDPIGAVAQGHLRNGIDEADRRLQVMGVDEERRQTILQPARTRLQGQGMAFEGRTLLLLLSESRQEVLDLGAPLPHRVEVSDHFVLSDLIAARSAAGPWHLLTVSDAGATLYRVEAGTPEEVDLPLDREDRAAANAERELPTPGGDRQAHRTPTAGPAPGLSAQGFGDEHLDDVERETWHREVRDALDEVLPDPTETLVLIATPAHVGGLRPLLEDRDPRAVTRDPTGLEPEELRDLALQVLDQETADGPTEADQQAFHDAQATTQDLRQALQDARSGRIALLFWDPQADVRTVDVDEAPEGAPDVLDEIVRLTAVHGGRTVPVPAARQPGDRRSPLAAALRW